MPVKICHGLHAPKPTNRWLPSAGKAVDEASRIILSGTDPLRQQGEHTGTKHCYEFSLAAVEELEAATQDVSVSDQVA